MTPRDGPGSGGSARSVLDALVLLALLATAVVLIAVAEAGPVALAAAGTFVTGCFGLWIRGRGDRQG